MARITNYELHEVPPRWLFLRVGTSDGLVGWGEPVVEGRARTVRTAVEELMEGYLLGESPGRIEDHWQTMYRGGFYRGGPVLMSAIAGIDQALWDLKGKRFDAPVYELLGGPVRDRVRVYQWIGGDRPADVGAAAAEKVDAGFTALKMNATAELRHVDTPAAVERVLGYRPEDLVGTPFPELMATTSAEDARAAYERTLDGDPVERVELDFLDADGDAVLLEVNATPITEDGEVVGVQGVGRDVTARRERQRELRIKDRAMDGAQVGISIADARLPDRPLVYVNEKFERMTGYDAAEAVVRNCRFFQGEGTDPESVALLRERIEAERPVSVELLNYRKDGTPFWNQLRISPITDDDGEVTH